MLGYGTYAWDMESQLKLFPPATRFADTAVRKTVTPAGATSAKIFEKSFEPKKFWPKTFLPKKNWPKI